MIEINIDDESISNIVKETDWSMIEDENFQQDKRLQNVWNTQQWTTYYSLCEKQSNKIISELNNINSQMNKKFNYLVISMSIYNIMENNMFKFKKFEDISDGIRKLGTIGEFEVYLDLYMPENEILISWDKQTSRDVKIDSILDGVEEKEIRIKITHQF